MVQYLPYQGDVNPSHEGPRNARIFVLAESPWKSEIACGQPLIGASGNLWNTWLMRLGLARMDLRIENLYPYQPPRIEIDSVPTQEILYWIEDLHKRVSELPGEGPVVIVTMGNYATYALTGKGKVKAAIRNHFSDFENNATSAEKKAGITSLRGSVYVYEDRKGRKIKVIPTIHPAAVTRRPVWERRCLYDWEKIKKESASREFKLPIREIKTYPSEHEVAKYTKFVEENAGVLKLATDIETWGKTLTCVGFAHSISEAIVIPTSKREEKETFLPYVKRICASKAEKILCNGNYDNYWLSQYSSPLEVFLWDIMEMHHAFDPVDNHSLGYLASVYTRVPFWKDEAKEAEEIVKYATNLEALWNYNAMDCMVTYEIYIALKRKLRELGLLDFYLQHYVKLRPGLFGMMRNGVRVDVEAQKAWAKELKKQMQEIRLELEDAAGENLFATETKTKLREPKEEEWDVLLKKEIAPEDFDENGVPKGKVIDKEGRKRLVEQRGLTYMIGGKNAGKIRYKVELDKKGFSTLKLHHFFFETLGLPKRMKYRKATQDKSVALDEAAIRFYHQRYPGKIKNFGNLLLLHREKAGEIKYMKGAWDSDGRIRCSYKTTTEAGRLLSASNPMGKGYNLQNVKR